MDVRIGITDTSRELQLELGAEASADDLATLIDGALAENSGMLWLTDRKGRRVGVPAAKLAYVEIGTDEERRVGFGAP